MSIPAGTRLEHYEVLGPLGAGGMGEVYRAHDSKLKRDVALKILPAQFVKDPSRLARFEREAQVLASLNHPNIAAIYGFEHDRSANLPEYPDGARFLVLELVEGPTLAERLEQGRLNVPDALRIAAQIAEAMEAAHDKGVLHRDLKPANVKFTPEGKVKVLDFGLAKALSAPEIPSAAGDATITMGETRAGVVMGTAAYMSPEQASGKPTDKRTDIFSFGSMLYEMLTGVKPFEGKSTAHIIVHVLEQAPDWSALPPLPSGIRELLEGCMQKDPMQRRRDIGDVRIQLQAAITQPVKIQQASAPVAAKRSWLWPAVAAAVMVLLLAGGSYTYLNREIPVPDAIRFEIGLPGSGGLGGAAVSPDGRQLVFVVRGEDGRTKLWIRSLSTSEAHPLDGTEDVTGIPFWSPDSRTIAFGADAKLKKIEAAGGPTQTLSPMGTVVTGGLWTPDGKIIFGTGNIYPLNQVSASGGTATAFPHESPLLLSPSLLPDGKHFLFSGGDGIYLASLEAGAGMPRRILEDQSLVAYAPAPNSKLGYLLFVRGGNGVGLSAIGTLMAQPFDPGANQLAGDAVPIAENVTSTGFSVSQTGVLLHSRNSAAAGNSQQGTFGVLTWLDRAGKVLSTVGDVKTYTLSLNLSPDAKRVVTSHDGDLYVFEFERGVESRLTFETGVEFQPFWRGDGSRIAYATNNPSVIYEKAANGAGSPELFFTPAKELGTVFVSEYTPDGRYLAVSTGGVIDGDIQLLPVEGTAETRKLMPLLKTQFNERGARFAPNGKFFSYSSDESGKGEAFVRPFDAQTGTSPGGQWMISKGGGISPHWRGDSKEMFYMSPSGAIMSVEIDTASGFQPGVPKQLFKLPGQVIYWDVTRDGQKFLIPVPAAAGSVPYNVIVNWTSVLKK